MNTTTATIKTYEDACNALGIQVALFDEATPKDEVAYIKLKTIIQALNVGWVPDWSNDEEKYYPWFDMENGFVLYNVYYLYQNSYVSSRLCFKNSEVAEYAATQFIDLYKDFFTI